MKKKRKTLVLRIILLVIFVLIILTIFIIIRNMMGEIHFSDLLKQVDNAYFSYDFSKTRALLTLSLSHANSKKQYLRVLKRAFLLAEKTDDALLLKKLALQAVQKKTVKELVFIAAYACLKEGDSSKALELLKKPKVTERLRSLKVETLLFLKKESLNPEKITEDLAACYTPSQPFRFLHLFNTDDPVFFEDAAHIIEDKRLFLDASLLYAHKGKIKEAFRITSSYEEDPLFYTPGIFIAYDAGEYTKAEQYINTILMENTSEHAVFFCLYGDIKMRTGEYDKTMFYYKKAIALDPLVSETAYLNISYICQEQGDIQKALDWLKTGFKYFPQNRNIALEASRFFVGLEKSETASSIIHTYAENRSVDFMIDLMILYLDQENLHPSRYRIRLWDLFNAHPGNEFLCRFLVVYLLGIEDLNGARSALTLFDIHRGMKENKQENLPWVLHYKGICEIMTGNYKPALELFALSLHIEENPVVLYHRSLLYIELGNLKAAQDDLFHITTMNTVTGKENKPFLSLATATLGEIFIRLREYGKAWDQLTRAYKIDPENYKVLTLMKELEELQQ